MVIINILLLTMYHHILHRWVVAALVDVLIMLCRTIRYRTSNGVLKFIALSCTFRMLNVALVMPRL